MSLVVLIALVMTACDFLIKPQKKKIKYWSFMVGKGSE
jgi:hypothetical protein